MKLSSAPRAVRASVCVLLAVILGPAGPPRESRAAGPDTTAALPAQRGFAATQGGHGGQIIRVTTLSPNGEGSLGEALATAGPRIIVFEVGGVIDLAGKNLSLRQPFVTVAGQTAPSPGITLIRGGLSVSTHDAIVQHLRVRVGENGRAKKSGWETDGIGINGHDVIVDHCSVSWATDENLSPSGPRFNGANVEQWRENTSHRVTLSNNIIAEGLSNSTHAKGEHSKGTLVHDNATEIAIVANLYFSNRDRNALFKGGARGVMVNNWVVNPGTRAAFYGLVPAEWGNRAPVAGQMVLVGNLLRHGPDTRAGLAFMTYGSGRGPLELYTDGNQVLDREGNSLPALNTIDPTDPDNRCTILDTPPLWPGHLSAVGADGLPARLAPVVGARPWDRDATDARIVRQALAGEGRIIDSEQEVEGYPPVAEPTRAAFDPAQWDLDTMRPLAPPSN
jgi:hypothetical protein